MKKNLVGNVPIGTVCPYYRKVNTLQNTEQFVIWYRSCWYTSNISLPSSVTMSVQVESNDNILVILLYQNYLQDHGLIVSVVKSATVQFQDQPWSYKWHFRV